MILERNADVGGTWWANTYPGCACDVPSHLYSFSFAPNPDWSADLLVRSPRSAPTSSASRDEHDLRRSIRFGTSVTGADWDEDAGRWTLETSGGPVSARVLIAAPGSLTEPHLPQIAGLGTFGGATFHSARWDHDHDLRGERVAVIGTGASAIQIVPAIQPDVARLHVFQRTPPWVMPHSARPIRPRERALFRRVPAAQRAIRAGVYAGRELLVPGFTRRPGLLKVAEQVSRRHLRGQVADPALRARLTPDYAIGCKRILPSNRWYPALTQPNVELVTDPIREVTPGAVVTADGTERPVDTIILGTGFRVAEAPVGHWIRGRGGRLLAEAWGGSPRAHLGSTVAGFPNLFLLLGPNTGLGHSSMVYMIESQIAYVTDALRVMRERGAAVAEVRPEVVDAYNRELDARMEHTVWSTGCSSWYQDATGRNPTLWPDWTWRFRRRTRRFDPDAHTLRAVAS